MAVIQSRSVQSSSSLTITAEIVDVDNSIPISRAITLQGLQSTFEDENVQMRRRGVRFLFPENLGMHGAAREELTESVEAKEAGVAYIMGHSYVKDRRLSSLLKKVVIDMRDSFVRKNCRGPEVALNNPHISLIEVGMIYYV